MENKQLSVQLHGGHIGILEQLPTGKMSFSYDSNNSNALQPLSLSMPIQEKSYSHEVCEAFFGGLLPESEEVKKLIGKKYGVSHSNSFGLLKAIGYDCAGAVSFHEVNDKSSEKFSGESAQEFDLEGKLVTADELHSHIVALPRKPLFGGFEDLRLSLAGVQDKAAVCLIEGKIALPIHGCPTTHILKPEVSRFPGMVENEFFCLDLANVLGLSVPVVELRHVKDVPYLLIERYDRILKNGKVQRIHQEDFCQALGIASSRKYQSEGGPGFKQCFELLGHSQYPANDHHSLISIFIFNFLIGNMDAHGKNFSLLHLENFSSDKGDKLKFKVVLAPFYDLICTRFFPELSNKMAMKIGSQYQEDLVFSRDLQRFCDEIGFSYAVLKQKIQGQSEKILTAMSDRADFYTEKTGNRLWVEKLTRGVETHIQKVMRRLNHIS